MRSVRSRPSWRNSSLTAATAGARDRRFRKTIRRRYSTEGIAALGDIITQWRQQAQLDADARRPGKSIQTADPLPAVEFSVVDVSFDAVVDPQLREYLQTLPTSFALSDEAVDRLRNAAAQVLRDSPAFRDFVAALSGRP